MLKTKEYHICDRCKEEIEEINYAPYQQWCYELCDICYEEYQTFKRKTDELMENWTKLEKNYLFGHYLPEEDEKVE